MPYDRCAIATLLLALGAAGAAVAQRTMSTPPPSLVAEGQRT